MPHILVLDANQRSALAVTRSLGRCTTAAFTVTTADALPMALAGQSRYSGTYLQYPDPAEAPLAFLAWVSQQCDQVHYDLVMPTTEVTSQLLLQHQSQLPRVRLAFSDFKTVMQLADKVALVSLAESLGVPVPGTRVVQSAEEVDPGQLDYPVVLKPGLSRIFLGDRWISTQVRILKSEADWHQALSESPYLHHHPFMLQDFIPGHGAGVFCLFKGGQSVRFFAHERLREKPPEGGVSVLSRSVPVDDQLRGYAEQLLSAVQWHGVAMVEFRVTPEGKPYLMEVNTRFWGSLQLAVDSGVDFPSLLACAELGLPLPSYADYQKNQRLRWLLGDLDSLYITMKRPGSGLGKLKRLLAFLAYHPGQRHEVNRWSDLKPAWFELKQYIAALRGKA
ncbi:MAG: ATP-grasp domain-containing protein [Saccharospirillum sp.]|nr:ATP-grasp domain-containing protein [Saccharospirillum sp.]